MTSRVSSPGSWSDSLPPARDAVGVPDNQRHLPHYSNVLPRRTCLDGCAPCPSHADILANALSATLDNFVAGVIVVGDRGRILHANAAARRMLSAREPVAAVNGTLSVHDTRANRELARAIAIAQTDEAIGSNGIGVALRGLEPAIAHVLPLARGDLHAELVAEAVAAVFVTQAVGPAPTNIGALAETFGLTPAETRTLEHLVRGATLANTAAALGVSLTTAKTHLLHVFSKTGVSRQTDLIALVHRLVPPIRGATMAVARSERRRAATRASSSSGRPRVVPRDGGLGQRIPLGAW